MPDTPAPPTERLFTAEDLLYRTDLGRCELVEGRLKPMSPTNWHHGHYVSEIDGSLRDFVKTHDLGKVLAGEVGIYVGRDPDSVRGADVAFI